MAFANGFCFVIAVDKIRFRFRENTTTRSVETAKITQATLISVQRTVYPPTRTIYVVAQ